MGCGEDFFCLSYVMSFTDKIYSAQETFLHHGENHSSLLLASSPSSTQLEQLTGSSSLGQLPIAPRPCYSTEKFMLDLSPQSLPCLPVRSHPVNVVSSLWKFLHLKTQLYPRWKFQRFYTLHLKNI